MASRWLAMICACQTRATDIMLRETTQSMRTSVTLDSWTGRVKARRSQDMVRYLLVLGSVPLLPANRVDNARGVALAAYSKGNQGAKSECTSATSYLTENRWFVNQ